MMTRLCRVLAAAFEKAAQSLSERVPPAEVHYYFVRHGESEANVEKEVSKSKADNAIRLTPQGRAQADEAGKFLADYLKKQKESVGAGAFGKIRVYHSSFYRARETARYVIYRLGENFSHFPGGDDLSYRENIFLFEQKAGLYDGFSPKDYLLVDPVHAKDYVKFQDNYGLVYAQPPLGESQIDTIVRTQHFFHKTFRDARRKNVRHVVVISHGVTIRSMVNELMEYPAEWLVSEKAPQNCWIRYIHGNDRTGYADEGYIFGKDAPKGEPKATQKARAGGENVYMLKPEKPGKDVLNGDIKLIDPYSKPGP
ncbi:MAG: phosphoglycerate mutase family protein [Alphaproteobacteria bacterium]|nr:phosphoglycerate mutase family protein [Alphaproteobacteria bacterium]